MADTSTRERTVTRGEQMLALRRRRDAASHPFFRGGFRPFFFGGASWALIALTLWICSLTGEISLPTALDPLAWHRHEMLFGFVGAVIAGFLLTAIPNWTGRLPIAGWPLGGLVALGRREAGHALLGSTSGSGRPSFSMSASSSCSACVAGREVLAANNRNLPVVGMILLFGLADASIIRAPPGF